MNWRTFRLPQAFCVSVSTRPNRWSNLSKVATTLALTAPLLGVLLLLRPAAALAEEALPDGIQRSLEGPDVVITAGKTRTVYEYRQNGRLRLVKIVPKFGRPYYLVPADQTRGYGDLDQANMLLPQWVIVEF